MTTISATISPPLSSPHPFSSSKPMMSSSQPSISEFDSSTNFAEDLKDGEGPLGEQIMASNDESNDNTGESPSSPSISRKRPLGDRDEDGNVVEINPTCKSDVDTMAGNLQQNGSGSDIPAKKAKTDFTVTKWDSAGNSSTGLSSVAKSDMPISHESISETKSISIPVEVVDLTADDDDDDDDDKVVLISDPPDTEVCLGRIDQAFAIAWQSPYPRVGSSANIGKRWPSFPVILRQFEKNGNKAFFTVFDATGRAFAKADIKIALILAWMKSNRQFQFSYDAKLASRPTKEGDYPGQKFQKPVPFSLHLQIYASKKFSIRIGRFLDKWGVKLVHPSEVRRGIAIWNPHDPPPALPPTSTALASSTLIQAIPIPTVKKCAEEMNFVAQDILSAWITSENMPEKEQDDRVISKLLPHQKQALHFMSELEKDPYSHHDGNNYDGKFTLWRPYADEEGQSCYYNIISGYAIRGSPKPALGGILADEMGLGKTLSLLALIVGSLRDAKEFSKLDHPRDPYNTHLPHVKGTLLILPLSTTSNWEEQIKAHIKSRSLRYYVYQGRSRTRKVEEIAKYDLVITTYDTIKSEFKYRAGLQIITMCKWFRIVLDEAHKIRGENTLTTQAVCDIEAERRWAVTGTPIQNRLEDLGSLLRFLRLSPFDEKNSFSQYIVKPFKEGNFDIMPRFRLIVDNITCRRLKDKLVDLPARHDQILRLDFSEIELKYYNHYKGDAARKLQTLSNSRRRSFAQVLRHILCLRQLCAHGVDLLNERDRKLAEGLTRENPIEIENDDDDDDEQQVKKPLTAIQAFDMLFDMRESAMNTCWICKMEVAWQDRETEEDTKPEEPTQIDTEEEIDGDNSDSDGSDDYGDPDEEYRPKEGTNDDKNNDNDYVSENDEDGRRNHEDLKEDDLEVCRDEENAEVLGYMSACCHLICPDCIDSFRSQMSSSRLPERLDQMRCPFCDEITSTDIFQIKRSEIEPEEERRARLRLNPKLAKLLYTYTGQHTKTKVLIESLKGNDQWSKENPDEAPIKSIVFSSWTTHLDLIQIALESNVLKYTRLDGSLTGPKRKAALNSFREDPTIRIFLITTGAGGLGLNLTVASQVYVMEPQFNPAAEAQAVDRVHRLGQKREVTITRFIMSNSIEEVILKIQKNKLELADLSLNHKSGKGKDTSRGFEELRNLIK